MADFYKTVSVSTIITEDGVIIVVLMVSDQ